jgi:hypothetical protein
MDIQIPCVICGNPCSHWTQPSKNHISMCGVHSDLMYHKISGTLVGTYVRDDIWNITVPKVLQMFNQILDEYITANLAKSGIYSEGPCPTCQRMNDIGNPKVKVCWSCGNSLS